jgi:hypothetical protein
MSPYSFVYLQPHSTRKIISSASNSGEGFSLEKSDIAFLATDNRSLGQPFAGKYSSSIIF